MIKIKAERIKGKDLKPGDLFSTASQDYWDGAPNDYGIGECVYVRTNVPASADGDDYVYKICIEHTSGA